MHDVTFDHISIAMHRMADAPAVLAGVLGGTPEAGAPSPHFRWGCWRYAGGGRLEVIEPRGEDGFLHRFLAKRGPGIHHVTFKVPSLRAACERAAAHGYDVVEYDDSQPDWKEAFLHPRQALGVVVQLAESSGSDAALWPWTGSPASAPPAPVTVVGLRTRVGARDRARRQWAEVLGGVEAAAPGDGLVYRWPGSAMRIAVEVDGAGPEGPIGIEVASDRAITIPPALRSVIGARFLQVPTA